MLRLLSGLHLLISLLLLLTVLNAKAAEIYNNNPPSWSGAIVFGYGTADVLADDFVLVSTGTIVGAQMDLWVNVLYDPPDPADNNVSWWIFETCDGSPGNIVAQGSGINLMSQFVADSGNPDVKFWTLSFDLDNPVAIEAGITYWLGFHLENGYWGNSLRKGYGLARSENGTFDNWEVMPLDSTFNHSFRLYDTSTFEPVITAEAGEDQTITNCESLVLDGSGSSCDGCTIVSWDWALEHQSNQHYNRTASGEAPVLSDLEVGQYITTLTVSDSVGTYGEDTMLIKVIGVDSGWDINSDCKRGLEEVISILQEITR